ncbi:S8 family serine peptidase [Blastococcus sp. SYSU D00922]
MRSTVQGSPPDAPDYGVTWGGVPLQAKRAMTVAVATLVAAGLFGPATASAASLSSSADQVSVIVREAAGSGNAPERAVAAYGGSVTRELGIIGGFTADVPVDRIDALRGVAGVESVSENASLTLNGLTSGTIGGLFQKVTEAATTVTQPVTNVVEPVVENTTTTVAETTAAAARTVNETVAGQAGQPGSLYTIANDVTGASAMWDAGYTGAGVDVAVIDSGAVPVDGFTASGKLLYGPDLSFEVGTPLENLDTNGHGTHMAGIIGGRDDAASAPYSGDSGNYIGMAPDARIVSIKVADALGHTDVSQAIAAIDWVTEHGDDNGLNVRVVNMSFGTDGVQSYQLDPLAYAAEQAWHKGIVVVVAVGNEGFGTGKVNNPATDPYVIAVGSAGTNGTADTADDTVSSFSNDGDGTRNPDVVAPGERVVSLRSPNSFLDQSAPSARVGEKLFRGSGTSQAAAVVSGAAALLISQRPEITPDEVKALLMGTANTIPGATAAQQGSGLIDLAEAMNTPTPENAVQTHARSTGAGSLDAARGSVVVEVDGEAVTGEVDVTGQAIDESNAETLAQGVTEIVEDAAAETVEAISELPAEEQAEVIEDLPPAQQAEVAEQAELAGVSWSGVSWSGVSWSGVSWSGVSWSGVSWSGVSWSGVSWSGVSWSGVSWSGVSWSGVSWSGVSWSGVSWSGVSWSGVSWSGADWS